MLFPADETPLSSASAPSDTVPGLASLINCEGFLSWSLPEVVWKKENLNVKMDGKNQKCGGLKVRDLKEKAAEMRPVCSSSWQML